MWRIQYADSVVQGDIPRLDHTIKQRIKKTIEIKLTSDPLRFGKPLRHSLHHLRSLRVGDYRVLYYLDHDAMMVLIASIGHRRDIYDA
jgi:mRNA interferase RelE/StbE